jgi:biopolymer transport protein ExbB
MSSNRKELSVKHLQMGLAIVVALGLSISGHAQESVPTGPEALRPSGDIVRKLEESLAELARIRQGIAGEKIALSTKLHADEGAQTDARKEFDAAKRLLDGRTLDMGNLRNEIKAREQEKTYLSTLLTEYGRNLESRLHIVELQRYATAIEKARLATENSELKPAEVFSLQCAFVQTSLTRLEELAGGVRFTGRAAGPDGLVKAGAFVLLGPAAYFAADDGSICGMAEQRLGSLEPAVVPFANPQFTQITRALVTASGKGMMPFDASLGNAHKVEETKETVVEHFLAGGTVMWPILAIAVLAALVMLGKWIQLVCVRMPGRLALTNLLDAIRRGENKDAQTIAAGLSRGYVGDMLRAGAAMLGGEKDLAEEAMFEKLLDTRHRLQRLLPFIAVTAACAPLLGLLGTVTGIITTFKMMTIFGSGDIKMLSSGISEALITTEYGLYVAIPAVLAHSFLGRKSKSITDRMEQMAISVMGEIAKQEAGRKAAV